MGLEKTQELKCQGKNGHEKLSARLDLAGPDLMLHLDMHRSQILRSCAVRGRVPSDVDIPPKPYELPQKRRITVGASFR
jgi:hypothetical protein